MYHEVADELGPQLMIDNKIQIGLLEVSNFASIDRAITNPVDARSRFCAPCCTLNESRSVNFQGERLFYAQIQLI